MIVFDLDGCLTDSQEPAGDLEAARAYVSQVAAGFTPLPPWETAEMLTAAGYPVALLTSSPAGTFNALLKTARSWPFTTHRFAASPEVKPAWLTRRGSSEQYVHESAHVYVAARPLADLPDEWRFTQYAGQDAQTLYTQVTS